MMTTFQQERLILNGGTNMPAQGLNQGIAPPPPMPEDLPDEMEPPAPGTEEPPMKIQKIEDTLRWQPDTSC